MDLNAVRLDKVTKMLIFLFIWGWNYQCSGGSSTNQKFLSVLHVDV